MSRILISGAAGFIGSHLVEGLLSQGHQVIGVDDLSGGFLENLPKWNDKHFHAFSFFKQDLCDYRATEEVFMGNRPEIVLHLAANARESASFYDVYRVTRANLYMSSILIELAIKYGTRKFVFFSSMSVYGKGKAPFPEDAKLQPCDPYGASKAATELTLRMMSAAHGISFLVLRPHNCIGVRQSLQDPFRNFVGLSMNKLMRGEQITIFGEDHVRAFSPIEDSLPAFMRAIEPGTADGETINVGGKEPIKIVEMAQEILKHFPEANQEIVYLPPRYGEVPIAYSTSEKSEKLLGYEEKVGWRECVATMAQWARTKGPQEWKYEPLALRSESQPLPWRALAGKVNHEKAA